MSVIHWFRRDLRLHDNAALAAAVHHAGGAVIPLFVFDDALLNSRRMSAARVDFLLGSLHALDTALRERGSRLIVRHGSPEEMLAQVLDESRADAVFFNRDYTPFARQRDDAISTMLRGRSVIVQTFPDIVVWEPDALRTKNDTVYTMYAPYQRQWRARTEAARRELLASTHVTHLIAVPDSVTVQQLPTAADLGHPPTQHILPGGEAEGRTRLVQFFRARNTDGIAQYHIQRDLLSRTTTSQLSPYLHFGCLSPLACVRAAFDALDADDAAARAGSERWLGELVWRDFYNQILYHFPHVLRGAFKPTMDALEWDNIPEQFQAWCRGQTGYPIVDAAMRQLNTEGWIPNRARLIVASFLVKDLLVDWRWGEAYFMQQLVDGDLAANNSNWQWVASSGTDAQPFFRMFSPISQSEKADPQGDYIRRYVPELAKLPPRYLHAPWTAPAHVREEAGIRFGRDYPEPIVDHATQRDRTLAMYRRVVKQQKERATENTDGPEE